MNPDDFLLWLTERGEGSWAQFSSAVATFTDAEGEDTDAEGALSTQMQLRLDLSRLGHVDFESANNKTTWRVAPPTFAACEHGGETRIVAVGARTLPLLDNLATLANGVSDLSSAVEGAPRALRFSFPAFDEALAFSRRAGFALQRDAPATLLAVLPRVADRSTWAVTETPFGRDWSVRRWNIEKVPGAKNDLRWVESSHDEVTSGGLQLLTFQKKFERVVLLRVRGRAFRINAQAAKYVLLRNHRRRVLRYDEASRTLELPISCRPPPLVERALVLASGVLPATSRTAVTYSDVQPPVAHLATALLEQDFA